MRLSTSLVLATLGYLGIAEGSVAQDTKPVQGSFNSRVLPILDEHCVDCHSAPEAEANIDFEQFSDEALALAQPELWWRVRHVIDAGSMPPETIRRRPSAEERSALLAWIDARAAEGLLPRPVQHPGRTTLRRLNRREYRHAVLDLLGVDYPTPDLLPADGVAHGFDVIGEALSMPPLLFEKYFDAAESIAALALPNPGEQGFAEQHFSPAELSVSNEEFYRAGARSIRLFTNGTASASAVVRVAGNYALRVSASAQQAGTESARLGVSVDGIRREEYDVEGTEGDPEVVEYRLTLEPGEHTLSASFVNDYYEPDHPDPARRDRNLSVNWIALVGPLDQPVETEFRRRFLAEKVHVGQVVRELAQLIWRGSVNEADLEALLELGAEEANDVERLRVALLALLSSPRFLFRIEPEPEQESRALTANEFATRLSAFLWNSVPDAALLELAGTGELDMPAVKSAQVDRLLRDAKSTRLATSFAMQWLQLERLEDTPPDSLAFPQFDDALRHAMIRESELFFEAVLREDRRISELLNADFTFLNETLAEHYGISGVEGASLRRVAVPRSLAGRRGGILGQGAVLTSTSLPTRTSPVRRGKWVLEALLATPPSPPPPGVDALDESAHANATSSIRERLERHRADPACAVCHAPMDGLGFALENFDAVGLWRERDGDFEIDASAELPGGIQFVGPSGLRDRLLSEQNFLRGLLRHLATYALGRALVARDQEALDNMLDTLPDDPTLRQVIHAVVEMEAFGRRYREEQDA